MSLEFYQSPGSQKVTDAKLWLAPAQFPTFIRIPASQLPLKGLLSEAHSCPSLCVSKRVAESTEMGNLKGLAQKMV